MEKDVIFAKNLSFCTKKKKELDDIRLGMARDAADELNAVGIPSHEDIRGLFAGSDIDAYTFSKVSLKN